MGGTRERRSLTPASCGLALVAFMCAVLLCTGLSLPAGAVGILPPDNPPGNITPSSADYLASIDTARSQEGVGPLNISEAALSSLPVTEQVFIVINDERIDRGLPAISSLTSQLNAVAQQGADAGTDPALPSSLDGGSQLTWGGSIWAGGLTSVLEADFYWMYADGYGGVHGGTTNVNCSPRSPAGCWGHRDIMLHQFGSCGSSAPTISMGAAFSPTGTPGGSLAAVLVGTCGPPPRGITLTWDQVVASVLAPPHVVGIATLKDGLGYWEAEANGDVVAFGAAADYGSTVNTSLNSPIVGIAATSDGRGYWLVAADGGIFSFGDASFYESMGGRALNRPIVGMAADTATGGYWLVAADGGIFSFNAPFFGSAGALRLVQPIVGMEALPGGQGYRFEAADGGVFDFGQASFAGSMGGHALAAPVVGMAADTATGGYWLVAADGGIFSFGDAQYYGRIT